VDVTAALRARLHAAAGAPHDDEGADGARVGVEHEFVVAGASGPADFRRLIAELERAGRRLDPSDPLAVRGPWGGVITADGREAEIATPPVALRPGFSTELAAWVGAGTAELDRALGGRWQLEGYSTHVSVAADDDDVVRAARRFVRDFALGQMLLLDRRTSPGLLVRPRRRRLELGGEYVAGDQRRAAAVYAAAGTASVLGGAVPRWRRRARPGAGVRPTVEPARGRYGFYVDRRAFGPDLYAAGRATLLRPGTMAQDVLAASWELARPFALGFAGDDEVALVDVAVDGRRPLPCEAPEEEGLRTVGPPDAAAAPTGRVVASRRRPGLLVEADVATWDGTVFEVRNDAATALVTVPRRDLEGFLVALDGGRLDDVLRAAVEAAAARRLPPLRASNQLDELGAYATMTARDDLVPVERDPITGRLGGAGRGGRAARERKDRDSPKRRVPRSLVAVAAVLGILVLLAALAAAVNRDEPDDEQVAAGGPAATTTLPPAAPTEGWSGTVSIVQSSKEPVSGSDATTQPFPLGVSLGGFTYSATFDGEVDANAATTGTATASVHSFWDHNGYYCYGGTATRSGSGEGPVTLAFTPDDAYPFYVTPVTIPVRDVEVAGASPDYCNVDQTNDQPIGGTDNVNIVGAPETPTEEAEGVRSGSRTFTNTYDTDVLSPSGAGDGTWTSQPTTFTTVTVITWHLTKLPDRDHDGIPDARDRCASKAAPATSADGCTPPDADGDGIPDATDACAGTEPKRFVDPTGCPTEEPVPSGG
jgi:hypothetical protein